MNIYVQIRLLIWGLTKIQLRLKNTNYSMFPECALEKVKELVFMWPAFHLPPPTVSGQPIF